jgi:SAM-dependent methyltransferase
MTERRTEPSGESQRVARDYRRYAESPLKQRSWSERNPGNVAIRAELVGAAFDAAGDSIRAATEILDIGCGSGWWLEQLSSDATAKLHGLELLPERADAAARRVPHAEIAVGDARELHYEDGRFTVVTLFTVLSSLAGAPDAQTAILEARRVLAPGGRLLIWEPRVANPFNPSTMLIGRRSLSSALAGMDVQTRTTTVFPPLARRLGRRTQALYPRLARIRALRTHRLVCARA